MAPHNVWPADASVLFPMLWAVNDGNWSHVTVKLHADREHLARDSIHAPSTILPTIQPTSCFMAHKSIASSCHMLHGYTDFSCQLKPSRLAEDVESSSSSWQRTNRSDPVHVFVVTLTLCCMQSQLSIAAFQAIDLELLCVLCHPGIWLYAKSAVNSCLPGNRLGAQGAGALQQPQARQT